jgi:ABC-type dipeptide/oligopeptide/nickel transport system permease component
MLGTEAANPASVERLRRELGLDRPWYAQYGLYLARLTQGDLGRSIVFHRPVSQAIRGTFPATVLLAVSAEAIALLIAVPAGVAAAARRNTAVDYLSTAAAVAGVSAPSFWIGLMAILIFGLRLQWLPIGGVGTLRDGLWSFASHLVLPSLALGAALAAILARLTRNTLLDVLAQDYIRTARAKGLERAGVLYKHALRNAMLPIVTTAGLQFGSLLGGAVVIETIFSWPGMGLLAVTAIRQRDLPVIQGSVLVFATCFVLVTLLTDLAYAVIDPRIQYD